MAEHTPLFSKNNIPLWVQKFLFIYQKITADIVLSQQIQALSSHPTLQQKMDECMKAEASKDLIILRQFLHNTQKHAELEENQPENPVAASAVPLNAERTKTLAPTLLDKKKRVYVDGVFDLMHFGHINIFRQAKGLGGQVIAGVNSSHEAFQAKGSFPIYSDEERAEMIRCCRWVDEVIVGTPYNVCSQYLDKINCDFVAHGNDIPTGNGCKDCYEDVRFTERMISLRRTEGVSTTSLLKRILNAADRIDSPVKMNEPVSFQTYLSYAQKSLSTSNRFLMSTNRLQEFINPLRVKPPGAKTVYIDGSFDIFHLGHVRILQKARELGDYLIVGVHDDSTVFLAKGPGFPVMNMLERALSVQAMKMVDEVIIGAPWNITEYMIESFQIDVVVRGTCVDALSESSEIHDSDPYLVPKLKNIYLEIESPLQLTTRSIFDRIMQCQNDLEKSIKKRSSIEENFWKNQ